MTEYITVEMADDGMPIFLDDTYGYDKAYFKGRKPDGWIRWGHPHMRPHWVPLVPKRVVDGWRKAGKPAPRNYDPSKHGQ